MYALMRQLAELISAVPGWAWALLILAAIPVGVLVMLWHASRHAPIYPNPRPGDEPDAGDREVPR